MQAEDLPPEENTQTWLASKLWRALLVAGGACLAGIALLFGVAAYHLYQLPLSTDFREPKRPALTLLASDNRTFAVRGATRGRAIALNDLPPYLIDAVIAMEDRRFYEHNGVDLRGLLRAAYANLAAGRIVQGGSTITQQVARLELLSAEQTFTRKIQEVLIAIWLERRLSKDEILTRYLNSIYLGAGTYGVDAASRRYFGKSVQEIGLSEAAMLAGLIQAPSRFAPTNSAAVAMKRAGVVLDAMVAHGSLSVEAAAEATARPAVLAVRPSEDAEFGYAADWVAAEARERLEGVEGDFRVWTTIDPALQKIAAETVGRWLQAEGAEAQVSQAALVALGPDGRVRAMVGGVDYAASQFNRAEQARRQPGSAFKLFVYLAALEAGFDLESRIADQPIRIGNWSPQNYDGRYHGQTTLTQAFAKSYNAAAVRLQEEIGRDRIIEQARAMGIRSPLEANPSLALGTNEVTLLELTAAYAAVRAGRRPVVPYVLVRIESLGKARFDVEQDLKTSLLPSNNEIRALLREAVIAGTGKAAALPVASYGKTGTSQDNRDAWFIGFAEDLVVGVWVGNDDGSPMSNVTGGRLPAWIWRDFMAAALEQPAREEHIAGTEDTGPEAARPVAAGEALQEDSTDSPPPAPFLPSSQARESTEPSLQSENFPPKPVVKPRRQKSARAQPTDPQQAEAETAIEPSAEPPKIASRRPEAPEAQEMLVGIPSIIDTATLQIGQHWVRLEGVDGVSGPAAREMAKYIGDREVACRPTTGGRYRCEVDGWDLSEVVIFNGGGRATATAPFDLIEAEHSARKAKRGLWSQ